MGFFNLNTERMEFLEKDLESIIWESNNEKLQVKGLNVSGKKYRQLRIGNYGIADLVTIQRDYHEVEKILPYLNITVFELKKDKAGISAFLQALKYCKGIKTYLEDYKPNIYFKLNIVLCSKKIDTESDYIYLCDLISGSDDSNLLNSLTNYSFSFSIDGINFKEEKGYNLINKGF